MDKRRPEHAPMGQFPVIVGEHAPGGIPLRRLAPRAAGTPSSVRDRSVIRRRVEQLRAAPADDIRLHYAVKGNPTPAVVQYVARLVDGLEVASLRELRMALDILASSIEVPQGAPGDLIAVCQSRARGLSASPPSISRPRSHVELVI